MKMAQFEPMDIDSIGNEFDDKENSLQISNVLSRTPCTEKGYEELDVSELNMKLRYSITPASSPMSRSYTANSKDNKTFNVSEDNINSTVVMDNANLTRSLNSTITKSDNISKSSKLPLQVLATDHFIDNLNSSLRRSLDSEPKNVTLTINGTYSIDENLSLPSTSSSTVQTPEATTPTNDIPKGDGGSPIMRGLKSVLNMFRSSQSPIPPGDNNVKNDSLGPHSKDELMKPQSVLASTPKSHINKETNSSKRSSPLKESIVFNNDLEKELQWSEESTIIFKQEKIPKHKLFLSQSTSLALEKKISDKIYDSEILNKTVEYMDVSYKESGIADKTMTDIDTKISSINIEASSGVESDGEFLDCESTHTKNDELECKQQLNTTILFNTESNACSQELNEGDIVKQVNQDENNSSNNIDGLLKNDMILHAYDYQFVEQKYGINNFNEAKDTKPINENNEQLSIISDKSYLEVETHPEDEINTATNTNMTIDFNMSSTNIETNNFKELPDTLMQHKLVSDDSKTSKDDIKENNLSITTNCLFKEQIEFNEGNTKNLDKTSPLNVLTDCQYNIAGNENNYSNNYVSIEKDNMELSGKIKILENPGILQICSSEAENYADLVRNNGHEHANNIAHNMNCKSTTIHTEEPDSVKKNEKNSLSVDPIIQFCIEKVDTDETNYDETKDTHDSIVEVDQLIVNEKVELASLKNDNDLIPNMDYQQDAKDYEINILKSNKDEIQNLKETTPVHIISTINDSDKNCCSNIENEVTLKNLPSLEPIVNLPSDISLPSDDDIEKDSLTDSFAIKLDNIKQKEDTTFTCVSGDKSIDQLETMDKLCKEVSLTKSVPIYSMELNKIPVPTNIALLNIEHISAIKHVSCDIATQSELLNSKIETLQECTPMALPDNKSVLTETIALPNEKSECTEDNKNDQVIDETAFVIDMDLQSVNYNNDNCFDNKLEEQSCNIIEKRDIVGDISNASIDLKENKDVEEEIITSPNYSPSVSVKETNVNVLENDIKLDEVENCFETNCEIAMSPPISPKPSRKGYNINFDEIDDPFATKVKIRISPSPEISPNNSCVNFNQQTEIKKKVQQNRRKSQPERQKRDSTKKRSNNSYSCSTNCNNRKSKIGESSDNILSNIATKIINENDKTDITDTIAISMLRTDDIDPITANNCDLKNCNNIDQLPSYSEESVTVEKKEESLSEHTEKSFSLKQNNMPVNSTDNTPKNVFNLPEIDDKNFNPFATKSKMRMSPSPTFEEKIFIKDSELSNVSSVQSSINIEKKFEDDKNRSTDVSSEANSCRDTNENNTVKEIHTDDEDTIEGPFLEAEEFADVVKVSDFGKESDMMQFEDLPPEIDRENKEDGELFIDAEAFEFFLNQNKSNIVADSGKESLFLKFDPLFAKRVSSDGVLSALNRIQKRQSTPKKQNALTTTRTYDEEKTIVGSSGARSVAEESTDEASSTSNKPMMVVNPAIHALVSPRKSTTPPRINRRSLTFTSPAMAVIDKLLSLSDNNSMLENNATLPRPNREYNETDIALTQLRELLAEKEINNHTARSENKELMERLATMESQVKTLEKESEERLKKVNDLNDRLVEKTKFNKSMAVVVEEYERTIASLIAEMDQEKKRIAEERSKLINERDEQTAHLSNMEVSFSDLHSKYEKSKQIIISMKANEDTYRKSIKEFEENILKMQNNYELLKQHATSKLNHANQEFEKLNRAHEAEVLKLNAMIKRKDLHIASLEESLSQKAKANEVLATICDELINKVG